MIHFLEDSEEVDIFTRTIFLMYVIIGINSMIISRRYYHILHYYSLERTVRSV